MPAQYIHALNSITVTFFTLIKLPASGFMLYLGTQEWRMLIKYDSPLYSFKQERDIF